MSSSVAPSISARNFSASEKHPESTIGRGALT
jgi:hypothetical protein